MRRMQYSPRDSAVSMLAPRPHAPTRQWDVDGIGAFFYTPSTRSGGELRGSRQGA
jgi:hypothetical protein